MRLITIKEAAEILRVNPKTVIRYLDENRLTKYRTPDGNGPVRLNEEEVRNFFRPVTRN